MDENFRIVEAFILTRLINAEEDNITVDANKAREAEAALSKIRVAYGLRVEEPKAGDFTRNRRILLMKQYPMYHKNCSEWPLLDIVDRQAQTIKDQAGEIKDVIKFKDGIIKALNKRLSDLGAQC